MRTIQRKRKSRDRAAPAATPREIATVVTVVPRAYFRRKNAVDRGLAAILLVLGLPVLGLLWLAVRLTSRGPGIYRQVRVGKEGRAFTMYKIRTMASNAEDGTGAVWAVPGDCRVTRLGRILRKLHLDELPQLVNVLRGDMALVGPRPERPEFVHVLAQQVPGYLNRLAVLPGVTGLAQINLPPDTDLDSVRRKVALDLEYIRVGGWFLDLRMLLCTAVRLLGVPGDHAMRLFRVKRPFPNIAAFKPMPEGATPGDLAVAGANGRASTNGKHEAQSPRPADTLAILRRKPK